MENKGKHTQPVLDQRPEQGLSARPWLLGCLGPGLKWCPLPDREGKRREEGVPRLSVRTVSGQSARDV